MRRVLFWLGAASVLPTAAACGHDPCPPTLAGGPTRPAYERSDASSGATCATPHDGCPCPEVGAEVSCGVVERRSGSYISCSTGVRRCLEGHSWGGCTGPTIAGGAGTLRRAMGSHARTRAFAQPHKRPLALAVGSVECDNPCDPYCRIYYDDAGGLDAAIGTNVAVDVGITIAPGCESLQLEQVPQPVTVTRLNPVTTTPPLVQLQPQLLPAGCSPVPVPAAWSVDRPDIATINEQGIVNLYAPAATRLALSAFTATWSASTQLDVRIVAAETEHAPAGTAGLFDGAAGQDDDIVWLYPYSRTVLPIALSAPVLQWDNHGVQAAAVKISLRYPATGAPIFQWSTVIPETVPARATLGAGLDGRNAISAAAWSAFERTARGQDALLVIQRVVGNVLRNEVPRVIHFADGGLRGRIYYTQYGRDASGRDGPSQIMKAEPSGVGAATNAFGTSYGCPVCHSVAANGNVFVASNRLWSPQGGVSAIAADGTLRPVADSPEYPGTSADDDHRGFAWAALTPDGRYALQSNYFWGNTHYDPPQGTSGDNGTGIPYAIWQLADALGRLGPPTLVGGTADTNWGLGRTAMMVPSFSPDGKRLVFIDGDTSGGAGWRKGLSTFDFDPSARAFSNRRSLYNGWSEAGWNFGGNVLKSPVFESDSRSVLFIQSTPDDLCHPGACTSRTQHGYGNVAPTNYHTVGGAMWSVDSANPIENPPVSLDNLNLGEGDPALRRPIDGTRGAFQPTALPSASGGYRWVVFDSLRPYGNTQNLPDGPSTCLASQLWVAAIDDAPSAHVDRSHPAFWLPHQLQTDSCNPAFTNERAFWVLEACKPAGSVCGAANECCQPPWSDAAMECRIDDPAPPARPHCVSASRTTCVPDGASCKSDADCCAAPVAACIAMRCTIPPAPPVYQTAWFARDFVADCGEHELPVWRFFDWQTVTPFGSRIVFSAQSADDMTALGANAPVYLATAEGPPVPTWSELNGVDVDDKLVTANRGSQRVLRISAELVPSDDKRFAPTLTAWRQSYDCIPGK